MNNINILPENNGFNSRITIINNLTFVILIVDFLIYICYACAIYRSKETNSL